MTSQGTAGGRFTRAIQQLRTRRRALARRLETEATFLSLAESQLASPPWRASAQVNATRSRCCGDCFGMRGRRSRPAASALRRGSVQIGPRPRQLGTGRQILGWAASSTAESPCVARGAPLRPVPLLGEVDQGHSARHWAQPASLRGAQPLRPSAPTAWGSPGRRPTLRAAPADRGTDLKQRCAAADLSCCGARPRGTDGGHRGPRRILLSAPLSGRRSNRLGLTHRTAGSSIGGARVVSQKDCQGAKGES